MERRDADAPREVRPGEELNAEALERVFAERLPEIAGPITVRQFPGGHSNLTYLVAAGGRELVLRRPPFGFKAIKSGHDMLREFRILAALDGTYAKAPRPYFFVAEEDSPLDAPFYVMERVGGRILRPPLPDDLRAAPGALADLSRALVATLAELHEVDYAGAGLADLGRPEGYVARQVSGWSARYERARTDDIPAMARVARWLEEHLPGDSGAALIHNDFKFDNVVFDPGETGRVRAILDWEMATVGDPLGDLGTSLAYWIEPDDPEELRESLFGLTAVPGNLDRAEVVEEYARRSGRDVGRIRFHYVLGTFKVAVIAQQIYARYAAGLTADRRFAAMIVAVRALAALGEREIEAPKLPFI
jgi:aminoglycoside phosphotransferase (APT) family kinase protein